MVTPYKIYKEKKKEAIGDYYMWYFLFPLLVTVLPQTDPVCWVFFLPAYSGQCPAPLPTPIPSFPLLDLFHWLLFSHFKEAPASLLSCFPIHPESHRSWLTRSWHFPHWVAPQQCKTKLACHFPWGCLHLISRTSVSGLSLSSAGHSFSVFCPWGTSSSSPSSLWVFSTSSL